MCALFRKKCNEKPWTEIKHRYKEFDFTKNVACSSQSEDIEWSISDDESGFSIKKLNVTINCSSEKAGNVSNTNRTKLINNLSEDDSQEMNCVLKSLNAVESAGCTPNNSCTSPVIGSLAYKRKLNSPYFIKNNDDKPFVLHNSEENDSSIKRKVKYKIYKNCFEKSHFSILNNSEPKEFSDTSVTKSCIKEILLNEFQNSSVNIVGNSYLNEAEHFIEPPELSQLEASEVSPKITRKLKFKGSDWLKLVKDVPNVKKCGIEPPGSTCKKKLKHDGFAARLKRLQHSWKSSILMWNHQMSNIFESSKVTSPLIKPSSCHILSDHLESSTTSSVKQNYSPILKTPSALRNLKDSFDICSVDSSTIASNDSQKYKKTISVRVISIGSSLPCNAAMCEVLDLKHFFDTDNTIKIGKKYIVYLALSEINGANILKEKDCIDIYAPWQHLNLLHNSVSAIFSSYFYLHYEHKVINSQNDMNAQTCEREVVKAKWHCDCINDPLLLPTMCKNGMLKIHKNEKTFFFSPLCQIQLSTAYKSLKFENAEGKIWTLNDALEETNGTSDKNTSITARVFRLLCKNIFTGVFDELTLICQDVSGLFFVIIVPPECTKGLTLRLLFENSEGSTQTFKNVSVLSRITKTEYPLFFDVVQYYQELYKHVLQKEEFAFLKDQNVLYVQNYCYSFILTAGVTEVCFVAREKIMDTLFKPCSTIDLKNTGQGRGSLSVIILYRVDLMLYCLPIELPDDIKDEITFTKESSKKSIIIINILCDSALPNWLQHNGSVMIASDIRDCCLKEGNFVMDDFTTIKKHNSKINISLNFLRAALPALCLENMPNDLVIVGGCIERVVEETAFFWESCLKCGADDIVQINVYKCKKCNYSSHSVDMNYSLEVLINTKLPSAAKVKLYKTTVEKILPPPSKFDKEGYEIKEILGKHIGPLACIVKQKVVSDFTLTELPY